MKQLKKVAKISFTAISLGLMISNPSQAAEENTEENLVEELQTKYTDYSNTKLEVTYKSSSLGVDDKKDIKEDIGEETSNKEDVKVEKFENLYAPKNDDYIEDEDISISEDIDEAKIQDIEKIEDREDKAIDFEVDKKDSKKDENLEETKEVLVDEKETEEGLKKQEAEVKAATNDVLPDRIQGNNRYETAVKIANQYKSLKESKEVILVNASSFADGISATSLSDGKMPILYVEKDAVPIATNKELTRRLEKNPLKVYLVGGEKVISKNIEDYLKSMSINVERISGANRYDTSAKAATRSPKKNLIITTGEDFSDPLYASSLASSHNAKILLTNPNKLDIATSRYLQANKASIKSITVVGGNKAVSSNVINQINRITGKNASRIYGENRYDGSVQVAKKVTSKPTKIMVASGQDFADALAIAPVAQGAGIPIILTKSNELPEEVIKYLEANRSTIKAVTVVGGQLAIDSEVVKTITNTLNKITVVLPGENKDEISDVDEYKPYFEKGVDLSRYNGDVNLKLAKSKDAIDFVILKAGSGANPTDSGSGFTNAFEVNYKKARDAGLNIGAYWYLYASNVEEAIDEANLFLKQLKGKTFEYPVFLDFEDPSQRSISKKMKTDMAIAFMDILEKNGYYTGIYSSASWLNNSFESDRLKDYDKWVAHWGVEKPNVKDPYGMWQTTNKAQIPGLPNTSEGGVDFNYSYKDYPSIIKRAGLNNF